MDTNNGVTEGTKVDVKAAIEQKRVLMAQLAELNKSIPTEAVNAEIITARQRWIDYRTNEYEAAINAANTQLETLSNDIKGLGGRVPRRDEQGSYHADPTKDRPTQAEQSATDTGNAVTTGGKKRGRKSAAEKAAEATQ